MRPNKQLASPSLSLSCVLRAALHPAEIYTVLNTMVSRSVLIEETRLLRQGSFTIVVAEKEAPAQLTAHARARREHWMHYPDDQPPLRGIILSSLYWPLFALNFLYLSVQTFFPSNSTFLKLVFQPPTQNFTSPPRIHRPPSCTPQAPTRASHAAPSRPCSPTNTLKPRACPSNGFSGEKTIPSFSCEIRTEFSPPWTPRSRIC